ncbi:hypothetical protein RSAG8_02417, partial [Rhizoctonia solani AG-8 WAC10335]
DSKSASNRTIVSGHGYAYEVEEGQGKAARIESVVSAPVAHPDSSPSTRNEVSNGPAPDSEVKFYREALLTEWNYPPWEEMIELQTKGLLRLDAYTRLSDEELNAMIAKLPKGTDVRWVISLFHEIVLICFQDVHRPRPPGLRCRGGGAVPLDISKPEEDQSTTNPFEMYPNSSPRNLFVPPVFYLHSGFCFDPKVMMGRIQGPEPLDGVQATVFAWSGYNTSRTHAKAFMSAFTSAVQDLKGEISQRDMFQEVSRRVGEATEGKVGHPTIQLWTSGDGEDKDSEFSMNTPFVV